MLVFLSWSGERSKKVAHSLESWLVQVIQVLDPWISSDIEKGARWSPEIAEKLEKSKVGVICLTRENLKAPWILFEAGALSKTKGAQVCTFLLDLKPTDVEQPLGQFQHTVVQQDDVRRLVQSINRKVAEAGERALTENVLDDVFKTYWPRLEAELRTIARDTPADAPRERSERDLLQEVLEGIRVQDRRLAKIEEQIGTPLASVGRPGQVVIDDPVADVYVNEFRKALARGLRLSKPPSSNIVEPQKEEPKTPAPSQQADEKPKAK